MKKMSLKHKQSLLPIRLMYTTSYIFIFIKTSRNPIRSKKTLIFMHSRQWDEWAGTVYKVQCRKHILQKYSIASLLYSVETPNQYTHKWSPPGLILFISYWSIKSKYVSIFPTLPQPTNSCTVISTQKENRPKCTVVNHQSINQIWIV